jgi:hypothetical protein
MNELKVEKERVLSAAAKCSTAKGILQELFPDVFKSIDFRDIKTYQDAVNAMPVSKEDVIYNNDPDYVVALKQLRHIIKVVNGSSFKVDWTNGRQPKWRPWFDLSSGFRFSDSSYTYSYTDSGGGSRLCFETEEKSDYVAKQFIELYKIVILN